MAIIEPANMVTPIIHVNAEAFVIPVESIVLADIGPESLRDKQLEKAISICDGFTENKINFDPKTDRLAQIWIVGVGGINSGNMSDHLFFIKTKDGRMWKGRLYHGRYMPKKIFAGHQEGDTIHYQYPVTFKYTDKSEFVEGFDTCDDVDFIVENCESFKAILDINLKLSQTNHRYRSYGRFENILASV